MKEQLSLVVPTLRGVHVCMGRIGVIVVLAPCHRQLRLHVVRTLTSRGMLEAVDANRNQDPNKQRLCHGDKTSLCPVPYRVFS